MPIETCTVNLLGTHCNAAVTSLAADSPDGDEQDHEQREDHLHIGDGVHAESAQQQQLQDLQEGEVVDLPLGHFADVVGGRVRRLQRGETRTGQQRPTNQPIISEKSVHSHSQNETIVAQLDALIEFKHEIKFSFKIEWNIY